MDQKPSRRELSHERIVDAAARAIRRSGYAGTGVADIMKEAGLTHGGFYAHFASRDALLAEAVVRAGRDSAELLQRRAPTRHDGASPLKVLVENYLSEGHLVAGEAGCVVAALVSEVPRQADVVREASAERVRALIERVRVSMPEGTPAAEAGVVASALVGTLQLARALGDEREARTLLKSTREAILARYDAPSQDKA